VNAGTWNREYENNEPYLDQGVRDFFDDLLGRVLAGNALKLAYGPLELGQRDCLL